MDVIGKYSLILISVLANVIYLDAVTVNPSLCPTNKIAPHRRHASWEQNQPRTFGLLYELLAPRRPPQINPLSNLQEQPQEDDPEDCGEIEDYDETDLSSVTSGAQRRKTHREHSYFFGNNNNVPLYYTRPNRPIPSTQNQYQRPTRPPYNFEETYASNGYFRPPSYQYPSGHIKPVKEDTLDSPQAAYEPGLVGGNIGHIVGFSPVRSTTEAVPIRKPSTSIRFPDSNPYTNIRQKKSQQSNKSTSIIGSFVDLLFN